MYEAAKLAGITNKNSSIGKFFALEPEAAVYYVSRKNLSNNSIIKEGNRYAICDLGGGTGDFVVHERTKEGCKELIKASGGEFGSKELNKYFFENVIGKLFGIYNIKEAFDENVKQYDNYLFTRKQLYEEWYKLEKEIDNKKKISIETKDNSFNLNCDFFKTFFNRNIILQDLVDNFNRSQNDYIIKIANEEKWILEIPNKVFYD